MGNERLKAFTDAVIAIIMTILVLELEVPSSMTWTAVAELIPNYYAYTLSFFWIGTMWINLHNEWDQFDVINQKVLWSNLILLFLTSLFPYVTKIVSANFYSTVAQVMYAVIVFAVTIANFVLSYTLKKANNTKHEDIISLDSTGWLIPDLAIKIIGFILTLTVFEPAFMISMLLAGVFAVHISLRE